MGFLHTACAFLFSTIRIATPLTYVAIACVIVIQAGLVNMAGESMLLTAALAGVLISGFTHSLIIGILGGALVCVALTMFLCFATFVMGCDLYLMSISLNLALDGGTIFVMYMLFFVKSTTAGLVDSAVMPSWDIPLIKHIPYLSEIISGHNGFTYLGFVFTFVIWFLLFRTKLGLRIRAVGQNPMAAESVGINPKKIQTIAFAITGFITAFGGMYLSMGYQNFFLASMSAARGYIGMSAANVGGGNPWVALLVSVVFGISYAVSNYLKLYIQNAQLLAAIPFMLSLVLILILSYWRKKEADRIMKANRKRLAEAEAAEQAAAAQEA